MVRKKREIYGDLPPRSDPNYMKMWKEKNKQRTKEVTKKWYEDQVKNNPNFWKERYDPSAALEYRKNNKEVLSEKQWKKRGIENMSYSLFQKDLIEQKNKCKICDKEMPKPQVDHDHKTGKYRGLLCVPCNNGLGVYELHKEKFEKYLMEADVK
jgi:hypothetical protein